MQISMTDDKINIFMCEMDTPDLHVLLVVLVYIYGDKRNTRTGICLSVLACARLGRSINVVLTFLETHLLPCSPPVKVYSYINVDLSRYYLSSYEAYNLSGRFILTPSFSCYVTVDNAYCNLTY